MKTLNFFGISISFIFVYLFCLAAFCGCGDTGDEPGHSSVSLVSGDEPGPGWYSGVSLGSEDAPGQPKESPLSEKFKWPAGTTGELWELTDADVAELLAINPPPDWPQTADRELYNRYYFAQLLKQFGDIPEVRYVIAFLRKPGKNVTIKQAVAYSEAIYRLFPNQVNLEALLEISSALSPPQRDARTWMKEDPEGYLEHMKEVWLIHHGDIPEIHTYVHLELKRLLGKHLTDAERRARNAAALHLQKLNDQLRDERDNDNDD